MIVGPKAIRFNLNKKVLNSLKHGFNFFIKHNGFLAEHRIEDEINVIMICIIPHS